MKKFLSFVLVFMLVLSMSMSISMAKLDETGAKEISFGTSRGPEDAIIRIADKTYPIKNETILFINGEIIPEAEVVIDGGKAMLPLRLIAEKLGYEVGWNNKERKVTLVKDDKNLRVAIGGASLDAKSESEILKNIINDKFSISIVVTHRFKNIKKYDEIIVMKDGEIESKGNHAYLMKNSAVYRDLYIAQKEMMK